MALRVATYNIRKSIGTDRRRRPDRVLQVISELNADIVALQEADRRFGRRQSTLPAAALAEAGWHAVAVGGRPDSLGFRGNAVLVRPGITITGGHGVELPAFEPRGAAFADMVISGTPLRVVAMHLGLTAQPRLRQAAAILARLERGPRHATVLMGDTNEWRQLRGALDLFGRHHHLSPALPSWHATRPMAALDRIMISRDLVFGAVHVHASATARQASDHLPVWADLHFAAEPGR
ncbi:MAG: endonuclease/exonuclease/phosphatase family protein [Rhodothalassiaceae bacterium]